MREEVFAPVNIDTSERRDRVGMIREMSRTGALFHSRSRFTIGERLELTYRSESGSFTKAAGTVVRALRDPVEDNVVFPFLTAIQFQGEAELAKH